MVEITNEREKHQQSPSKDASDDYDDFYDEDDAFTDNYDDYDYENDDDGHSHCPSDLDEWMKWNEERHGRKGKLKSHSD